VGLSNSRVDAEREVDVALKNILRLSQNATIDGKSIDFRYSVLLTNVQVMEVKSSKNL
jgi:hypothetical protein